MARLKNRELMDATSDAPDEAYGACQRQDGDRVKGNLIVMK